ncbi:MAG: hypothetical protein FWG35_07320 [Spirochaetaceae bacterium]|nr:hypothetical protein [Spirochaetaceae bacterium]
MGRIHTLVFYAGAAWETGRFFFIFSLVSAVANPRANPLVSLLFLWLGSGQLCAALLFFLCGYMPGKFFSLRGVTAVFTFMGILPPLALAAGQKLLAPAGYLPGGLVALLGIAGIDALFLVYLFLFRREEAGCT